MLPPSQLPRLPGRTSTVLGFTAAVLGFVAAVAWPSASAAQARAEGEWRFTALLDERPIGSHHFKLSPLEGGSASLLSEARFDVTLLGLTLYRYRHRSAERWSADCLATIDARTDDDGTLTEVRGRAQDGDRFALEVRRGEPPAPKVDTVPGGCVMTFAYWHPGLASQSRLLDPGSGRVEAVRIAALPAATIDVQGRPTPVRGLRIGGLARPIDVWYAGQRWVGLDTEVEGGRRLSYRLR